MRLSSSLRPRRRCDRTEPGRARRCHLTRDQRTCMFPGGCLRSKLRKRGMRCVRRLASASTPCKRGIRKSTSGSEGLSGTQRGRALDGEHVCLDEGCDVISSNRCVDEPWSVPSLGLACGARAGTTSGWPRRGGHNLRGYELLMLRCSWASYVKALARPAPWVRKTRFERDFFEKCVC